MARRRFQKSKPKLRGDWWVIRYRRDHFDQDGRYQRKQVQVRLGARASMSPVQAKKAADEELRRVNGEIAGIGGAMSFRTLCAEYEHMRFPKLAVTTRGRYKQVIRAYLLPSFGKLALKDISPITVDDFFNSFAGSDLMMESVQKIRTVLASIMKQAVRHRYLTLSPVPGTELPRLKGTARHKLYLTPEQFDEMIRYIREPYATMVYVAVHTGLRVSEIVGLRWNDIHPGSITVDERYCRGDWDRPKSDASNATIPVSREVVERIYRLKLQTVAVKAGRATRKFKLVKKDGPNELVFQSVRTGKEMRDNNILIRHIKPAGAAIGVPQVNWRCLRTSCATWHNMRGTDVKDCQGLMRHARISTTMDIYAQTVAASQKKAVDGLARFDLAGQLPLPTGMEN